MYGKGGSEYKKNEVLGASPLRLVIMAYDLAIKACDQKDVATAVKAISALRDSLDFEYAETAFSLLSLYQWCVDCIAEGDFLAAKNTLVELRDAWATVERNLNPTLAAPPEPKPSSKPSKSA